MAKKAKKEKRPVAKIDFSPYGAAIKDSRKNQNESRNKVGDEMYLSPRYHISVSQILYGEAETEKSTNRRQLDTLADDLTDTDIKILIATAQAILDARAEDERSCAEQN